MGTTVPLRLLQGALVFLVLRQMSQFPSFGKWWTLICLLGTTFARAPKVIHEKNSKILDVLEHFHHSILPWTPVANQAHFATHHPAIPRRHFNLGFRFLLVHATSFLVLKDPLLRFHSFLLLELPCSSQFLAMKMLEKPMKKRNSWTNQVRRMVHDLMCRNEFSRCSWWDVDSGHSSIGNCTQILRRVFQVRHMPVYFQEALPSRISPILFFC